MTNLNLLVIRAKHPAKLAEFYRCLGLEFLLEQHGTGPEHYCSVQNGAVFEIYPKQECEPSTSGTRLGFAVERIDNIVEAVKNQAQVLTRPQNSHWGRRAVLVDPEGHRVELLEAHSLST